MNKSIKDGRLQKVPPKPATIGADLLTDARLPKRFWNLGQKDYYGSSKALASSLFFIRNFDQYKKANTGLCLFGEVDSGKTFLICLILKHLLHRGHVCKYVKLTELYEMGYGDAGISIENFLEGCECVAIDGLDEGTLSGKQDGVLKILWRALKDCQDSNVCVLVGASFSTKIFLNEAITGKLPQLPGLLSSMTEDVPCRVDGTGFSQDKARLHEKLEAYLSDLGVNHE